MRARMLFLLLVTLLGAFGCAASARSDELPLVEIPAPPSDRPLVVLLSGDGDWSAFMRRLATAVNATGSPVLGLESRTYFATRRTPEGTAAALEQTVREHLDRWQRHKLVIVGYSRGADVIPFVLNRWPSELRARVQATVLIAFSENASFEFHLDDLIRDVRRATDVPTRPEMEKASGIASWCIHGVEEEESFCQQPVSGMQVLAHPGAHRAYRDDGTIELVLQALGAER